MVSLNLSFPEKFHLKKAFKFPKRKFGKQGKEERSLKAEWCEIYTWLHYDVQKDVAFCHLCIKTANQGKNFFLAQREIQYFLVRASHIGKKQHLLSIQEAHQASGCHHEATEALIVLPKQIHDVGEALCKEHEREKACEHKNSSNPS